MHFATNEEKIEVIKNLIERGVPLYYSLFQISLQRKLAIYSETKKLKK